MKRIATAGALLTGGLAAAALALPGGAQAAEIGQTCDAGSAWPALHIQPGDDVHILGAAGEYYLGMTATGLEGYVPRWVIDESSCRW